MGTCPVCFRYTRQRVRGCRHTFAPGAPRSGCGGATVVPFVNASCKPRACAVSRARPRTVKFNSRPGHMGGVCVATTPSASGLEVGDRITHINAVRVRNSARAVHMMQSSQSPLILRTRRWMFQPWW